jgi:hypothetical protein
VIFFMLVFRKNNGLSDEWLPRSRAAAEAQIFGLPYTRAYYHLLDVLEEAGFRMGPP